MLSAAGCCGSGWGGSPGAAGARVVLLHCHVHHHLHRTAANNVNHHHVRQLCTSTILQELACTAEHAHPHLAPQPDRLRCCGWVQRHVAPPRYGELSEGIVDSFEGVLAAQRGQAWAVSAELDTVTAQQVEGVWGRSIGHPPVGACQRRDLGAFDSSFRSFDSSCQTGHLLLETWCC